MSGPADDAPRSPVIDPDSYAAILPEILEEFAFEATRPEDRMFMKEAIHVVKQLAEENASLKALGWVYGAAASLIDSVNWTHFAEVARATVPGEEDDRGR